MKNQDSPVSEEREISLRRDISEQSLDFLSQFPLTRIGREPLDNATSALLASMPLDTKSLVASVAAEHGISTEVDNEGKTVFYLPLDGKKHPIALDASQPIEAQIKKIIADKVQEIERRFGVRVAPVGETVKDPSYNERADFRGKGPQTSTVRSPRLDELMAIELSISSCEPSQIAGKDKKPLTLYFLDKTFGSSTVVAQYDPDLKGSPAVMLFGNNTKGRHIEEPSKKDSEDVGSLHRIIVHELAHHAQFKTGWTTTTVPDEALTVMGWAKSDKEGWNNKEHLFTDRDGNKYRYAQNAIIFTGDEYISLKDPTWIATNKAGEPLKGKDKKLLTPKEMAEIAKVKPPSLYFPNPAEMYAEALTAFRLNEAWRAKLIESNSQLYDYIKRQDQMEIDSVFGKGKKIRGTDGRLVDDTADRQKEIVQFEKRFARTTR